MNNVKTGYILGNGSAINVVLGFIPDYVKVVNVSDGDLITEWFRGKVIPFSSGGTTTIVVGDTITGATGGATAVVRQILLASGSWAGGDAAGFFICDEDDISGTFGTENVFVGSGTDDAAVTIQVEHSYATAAAVAAATGNAAISSYVGVAGTTGQGFTIGSTVSENDKLLRYVALRNG